MPEAEDYLVKINVSYEITANGKFLCSGAAPGEASASSWDQSKREPITLAAAEAMTQASVRAGVAIRASEKAHRIERGEKVGD